MSGTMENNRFIVQVFVGALSQHYEALSVEASKQTTSEEIVTCIVERLSLIDPQGGCYELAEVIGDSTGQECKERRLGASESPVGLMLLWPKIMHSQQEYYRFYLREKLNDILWTETFTMDPQLIRDYFCRFLYQPKDREYPDLCQLPELNEQTLLDNLRARFTAGHIYTYVGTILIAVNPFKFHPIYNPKYVKLYQNRRLGPELPPHIFAVADTAYHCMLKERRNQCIVISGESGSGKTESTNFLLHHLTALSQKGSHGSGVEQTILSAGPVLEAFGNAKTAHNNNSSRFGKFIQVNYKENGMVHGAVVQKYLLEKSRICSQGRNERNYHVFYYLLAGASDNEKQLLHLRKAEDYHYLSRCGGFAQDSVDEKYEFSRLKQSMEMVGFTAEKQRRLFAVLSAVLLLGNVDFQPRKSTYHHDESVSVKNPEVVALISELLRVKQETLLAALTAKRARASGETLVINYKLPEAFAARDAMAKCLYGALFDWIVLQVNHALLAKKDTLRDHQGNSIGVLDIFGFEDFGLCNSFEQFCINYANEHLQHYFNQHVFKYEQEEYRKEGIRWTDIDFMDNTACLQLIEGKPSGLLCMLDDQCNFPGATNETLLQKFNSVHKDSAFYEVPQRREAAFIVRHYAGKVKYQVAEMREKNLDLMRQDIVGVLKNSSMAFVRELVGADPVAVFRWAIVRAFFRGYFAFHEAGRRHRLGRDGKLNTAQSRYRNHIPNESLISNSPRHSSSINSPNRVTYNYNKQRNANETHNEDPQFGGSKTKNQQSLPGNNHNRLSWPQFHHRNTTTVQQRSANSKDNENKTTKHSESAHSRRDSLSRQQGALGRVLCPDEAKVMERANQIVMKNKSFRPRERGKKGLKNLQSVKTLAGRTQSYGHGGQLGSKARKQPMTVTAQFQHSLNSLMETLNMADPFFIRCIKSNTNKIPNEFDEETVQRQLRYTGMLETVRIRQAGYNVRLSYDEFIQLYRILLPRGLVSSQADVRDFLLTLNLNRDNYQMGSSKIFLRESEKVKLDCRLHQQIMASIVTIQRWSRAILERRKFLRFREAAISIQSTWRMVSSQRLLQNMKNQLAAAIQIQSVWRGRRRLLWYKKLQSGLIVFQAHVRGNRARLVFRKMKDSREQALREAKLQARLALRASLSKDSSQENLNEGEDSDESNTIPGLDDGTSIPATPSAMDSVGTPDSNEYAPTVKHSKKKLSALRTNKVNKTDNRTYLEDVQVLAIPERKSSTESLTSQKSVEKDKSRDTLYKAKKQIQALMGVGKNKDKWDTRSSSSLNEADLDDCNVAMTKSAPPVISAAGDRFADDAVWQRRVEGGAGDASPSKLVRGSRMKPKRAPEFGEKQQERGTEPPIPIRQRRQRAGAAREAVAREVVCRSMGEEVPDSAVNLNPMADTVVETRPVLADVRASWKDRSSGDSESSSRYSQDWSPHLDSVFLKSGPASPVSPHVVAAKRNRASATGQSLDLKRRNSDPASNLADQVSLAPSGDASLKASDLLEWKGTTMFTIAGHRFGKVARFSKEDKCVYCSEPMDAFVAQGHKCTDCKQLFHIVCIQNGGVVQMPCVQQPPSYPGSGSGKPNRRKTRKHSRTPYDMNKAPVVGKFSLTGTSEFTDSTDKIISDAKELQLMQDFITKKIYKMESEEGKKPSKVDRVFKEALREFKANLVATYSVINKQGVESLNIKYKDLIANFLHVMETGINQEHIREDFPVTMYVNAFRGFMNEFMNLTRVEEKPNKAKRKKEKKRKVEDPIAFLGHNFLLTIINIPTACEICTSFFLWPIERGLVCQNCKLTCHKKCYARVTMTCGKDMVARSQGIGGPKVFGVPLHQLAIGDGKVPIVVDRLITTIEVHGLYTEGLYRKSGVSSKVKELKALMDEATVEGVNFETYQVHVLAAVLKSFLREMPEPLLTFDCYEAFLRAGNLTEAHDRISTLFAILKKLPKPNFDLMERLIFHLARVALHEDANRMNPGALAIVFAPCILRTNKAIPAQDSLHDISRQTQCIETIIRDQLRKVRSTLADIDTLDTACHTATHRLSSLRSSKIFSPEELLPAAAVEKAAGSPADDDDMNTTEEEALLMGHIEEIQKEKELLTSALPSLRRTTSDDDLLSTDDGSLDDVTMPQDDDNDGNRSSGVSRKSRQRSLVSRSVSGGEEESHGQDKMLDLGTRHRTHRQSASDISVVLLQPAEEDDCDEDPIMV